MHLLYLDVAGSASNKNENYLVLAGLSVFEAQVRYLTKELDKLAEDIAPGDPHSLEFRSSEIFAGRVEPWNGLKKEERKGVIKQVLRTFAGSYDTARAFAAAVHMPSFPKVDPMEMAFEDLASRFDLFLRCLKESGDRQWGLIIFDNSLHETRLQRLARDFITIGTRWNRLRNISDTAMFLDSRASRLIQVADHIAYAVFRRYDQGDTSYFDIIEPKFYQHEGKLHGLSHRQLVAPNCPCPACLSRRASN